MVNSSPEYAITKPGLRSLSRKRDKPLRTYGKRSTATPEPRGEPPLKRMRTTGEQENISVYKSQDVSPARNSVQSPNTDSESLPRDTTEVAPATAVAPKQTILNYFKPVAPPLTETSPSRTNIVPSIETPSPEKPGNTKQPQRPRRRLLRIRSEQSTTTEESSDEKDGEGGEDSGHNKDDCARDASLPSASRLGMRTRRAEHKRPKHKAPAAAVQTTLNISNQAAFSECKICDTVWNPLYPDDVKYHTKRHATHLRSKKRLLDEAL